MGRKYSGVIVAPSVYCSSSGDYFATVNPLDGHGQRLAKRSYWINDKCFVTKRAQIYRPYYLIEMVIGALQKLPLVVYENTPDRARRYTDLRYGSLADLRHLLGIGPDPDVSPPDLTG